MAKSKKKKKFNLDFSALEDLITNLDESEHDIKKIVSETLEETGRKVGADTVAALAKPNLPAGGKYSTGETEKTVVLNLKTEWSGTTATIGIGFDFSKEGAGGFLISGYYRSGGINGTARMKPDIELQKIYGGWATAHNRYKKELQQLMAEKAKAAIDKNTGGS